MTALSQTPFAINRRKVQEQNRLAALERRPEVEARIKATLKRLNRTPVRIADPKCDRCGMAQKFGRVIYCRCMV